MEKTICFFNTTKSWGGGEKWHLEIATEMFNSKFKVLVVVSKESALHQKLQKTDLPVAVLNVANFSFLNPFKVKKAQEIFLEHNVQTVIMNSSEDMKFASLAAHNAKVKSIIYRRGSAIPIKNSLVNRYFFGKKITAILANSETTKRTINENNANMFEKERITVIPNGIDTQKFLGAGFETLYSKTNDELVIGNLGRCVHQKNQDFLIDLAYALKQRKLNFKVLIGGDGKLKETLIAKAKKLDVSEAIIFTGFVKNPKDLMMSIDVFMLPSLWEGFGYVIAEAMLCRKPVVAFDVSSNPELVKHYKNGYLTGLNDVHKVCDYLEELHKNPQRIDEMGTYGKEFIVSGYDMYKTVQRVKEYILSN